MPTTCALCGGLTAARQYIRIVPAFADEETPGGFALGDRLHFHIRHPPVAISAWVARAGEGVANADSYKLGYNPPWQVAANPIKDFVEAANLTEAIRAVRDRVFKWFRDFPRDDIVRITAAAACGDDSALPDMITLFKAKSDDELYEKCLSHAVITRLQLLVTERAEAAPAEPASV